MNPTRQVVLYLSVALLIFIASGGTLEKVAGKLPNG